MTKLEREKQYIAKWRRAAMSGDTSAVSNVAAGYRAVGNFRLAARWYERAADKQDGDAMVDWGYCLQHGVGVRKDQKAAAKVYRSAIASRSITDFGREEAMYHFAVVLIGRRSASSRRAAARLLSIASADEDYPQAQSLLRVVRLANVRDVCICRRHLRPGLARGHCPLHGPLRDPKGAAAKPQNASASSFTFGSGGG